MQQIQTDILLDHVLAMNIGLFRLFHGLYDKLKFKFSNGTVNICTFLFLCNRDITNNN